MAEIIRNERKTRIGIVASNKMDKTITVEVHTKDKHPIYKKTINKTSSFKRTNVLSVISLKSKKQDLLAKQRDGDLLELLKKLSNKGEKDYDTTTIKIKSC